ncbi:extradiol dioxygenase [Rhizocola hellebori]|uniref:Extradiol dioxygenase n=1 Tax=Rhizocola hellebori TaxID=1392758 RepID=A0A8J3QL26_9ACTN|nr:glyoxalase superfamily protein [Rhizocola hellebori]GIH11690.1 extradiol dioxygenase [Rhizocola hellebori]
MFDELFPILSTADMAKALGFYRDLLGARVTYQFPPEGDPDYVSLTIGGSSLGIAVDDKTHAMTNDRVAFWVYTSDCDAAIALLSAGGVQIVQEPADQPWGERMAEVRDPDGNRVLIAARG